MYVIDRGNVEAPILVWAGPSGIYQAELTPTDPSAPRGRAERKERTLQFVLSLPLSHGDYVRIKVVGLLLCFFIPWAVLSARRGCDRCDRLVSGAG